MGKLAGAAVAAAFAACAAVAGAAIPATATGSAAGGWDPSSCDVDGVRASYVLEARVPATVTAVVVRGIGEACRGQTLDVVLQGRSGAVVITGPTATVPIPGGVEAGAVTQVGVSVSN